MRRFPRGPSGETLLERAERVADAYGLVLFLILTTFVVTVTLPPHGWGGRVAAVAIAGTTAIIALTSSDVPLGRVRLAALWAVLATVLVILGKVLDVRWLLGIAFVIVSALLAVAAWTILRRVLAAIDVNFRTILGAISVYTLIGLLFGNLFLALGELKGGDVFAGLAHAQARDYMFFSYTTLTTTGYGNLVPQGDIGEILAVFEMLTGQIFLVTLVAGLVSLWRPGLRPADSAVPPDEPGT
jgi:Ion channel